MRNTHLFAFLFVFIGILSLILIGSTRADQVRHSPRPPRPIEAGPDFFLLAGTSKLAQEPQEPQPSSLDANEHLWSWIAYQSLPDLNDWEIFVTRSTGDEKVRLTDNGDHDMYPSLDRGTQRVAYASNPDGQYDIYVIPRTGGSAQRLTFDAADDYSPDWSPDGARIAFQAIRNGQSEIYVMNADGSAQVRLTYDGAYDGVPSWSPDGQKIAFSSNRSGGYRIWVMNADGSNPQLLSNQPLSENPSWHPDGSSIVYDADGDYDGWQELYMMNADGSGQHMLLDVSKYGQTQDAFAGSWSPDGKQVGYNRVHWFQYQGQWYWDQSTPCTYEIIGNYGYDLSLGDYYVWDLDWETEDITPPTSYIEPLLEYSRDDVYVVVTVDDPQSSYFYNFEEILVQTRDGSEGSWVD